jgi:hypothetical protein
VGPLVRSSHGFRAGVIRSVLLASDPDGNETWLCTLEVVKCEELLSKVLTSLLLAIGESGAAEKPGSPRPRPASHTWNSLTKPSKTANPHDVGK